MQRIRRLARFLIAERSQRCITPSERLDLEIVLTICIFAIMFLLHAAPNNVGVSLSFYFLPVSVSAIYLGRYRAGLASVLCILTAIFVIQVDGLRIGYLEFSSWASILMLSALMVGTLSEELNSRFEKIYETHVSETRTDALTNVANRRSFDGEMERQLELWEQEVAPFCLALVDIDHFKRLNDTYGHQAGDKVLHDVARSIEATVRQSDFVARYGGEEFAVLMPNTTLDEALEIAERVRLDIEATRFFHNRVKLRLTISVGVSDISNSQDAVALLRHADDALYTSKQAGRNCVHFHTGDSCEHFGAKLVAAPTTGVGKEQSDGSELLFADKVTSLPTRQVFMTELTRRICESIRYNCKFTIAMIRLNSVSELERYGEAVTNRAITIASELIRGIMRETDLVVRYSSDTFAVLMPFTLPDQALGAVDRVIGEIGKCDSLRHQGQVVTLSASAGIASSDGEDASVLIDRAFADMEQSMRPAMYDLEESATSNYQPN